MWERDIEGLLLCVWDPAGAADRASTASYAVYVHWALVIYTIALERRPAGALVDLAGAEYASRDRGPRGRTWAS